MRKTILIVEDDLSVAVELQRNLAAKGFNVPGVAASGKKALAMAATLRPDVAIVDLHMKDGLGGVEIARRLRGLHGCTIIYLTAGADVATMERAQDTEPAAYLLRRTASRLIHSTVELALLRQDAARRSRDYQWWLEALSPGPASMHQI